MSNTITTATLKDACGRYLEHLKAIGKKPSTLGTTRRTLDLLIAEMGETKEVGKILPLHVDKFFKSESATMQSGKDGPKPRAEASVLQIRRIVRSAFIWWKKENYSARLTLPATEKRYLEPKAKKAKTDIPKQTRKAKAKTEKPAAAKADKKAKGDKAWTGFNEDEDPKAPKGKTVAKMHFGKEGK